jgi:membrane protease YdiL (CAAX protease family)
MKQGFLQGAQPFTRLLLVAFLMSSCYMITLGLSIVISYSVYGTNWETIKELIEVRNYSEHISLLKFLQICYSTGLFLVPALAGAYLLRGSAGEYLHLNRAPSLYNIILVILLMFAIIPLINFLAELNNSISFPERLSALEENIKASDVRSKELMDSFLHTGNVTGLLTNLLMIAVIPSLGEEFLFRGVIQKIFYEWTRSLHAGVWIAAVLFSMMHFQYFGFFQRILLGASFGYILVWSGSMWLPVLAHLVNNSIGVVYFYLLYNGKMQYDLEAVGAGKGTNIYLILSFLATGILMSLLYFSTRRKYHAGRDDI